MMKIYKSLTLVNLIALAGAAPLPDERAGLPPPSQDPFYKVPDNLEKLAPGSILSHRRTPAPISAVGLAPVNLQASYQLLYKTTDSFDKSTATVLTVLIPYNANMKKLLSYQIAQDAPFVDCAPSYALQLSSDTGPFPGALVTQAELALVAVGLEKGWPVIIPDHQGPKGAFLANKLGGHAVLDGIRAAIHSRNITGIDENPTISLWGYSGGTLPSAWAMEMQQSYAPDVDISGAALGGIVPKIPSTLVTTNKGPFAGLIPSGILGLAREYPEINHIVEQNVRPAFRHSFTKAGNQCFPANAIQFFLQDVIGMFDSKNVFFEDPAASIMSKNAVGQTSHKIPMYVYKSILDEVSPIEDTDQLVQYYCSNGGRVEYARDLVSEHGALVATGAAKAFAWLMNVMDGKNPKDGCTTENVVSSLLDPSTVNILPQSLVKILLDILGRPVGPLGG